MPHTFHETAIAEGLVGRTPWSGCPLGQVPLDPLFAPSSNTMPHAAGRPGGRPRTGASAPPFLPVCVHGKVCGIRQDCLPHETKLGSKPMDYKQEIRGYVAEHFLQAGQGLEDTTPLISGGLIDSIGMLGLISFMESRFGVEFMPREVDAHTLDNVNLIAALIDRKLAAKAS